MSNRIEEKVIKIEIDEAVIEVLCDVVHNNWPDGIIVRPIEIQGINAGNYSKKFLTDVANECHEQIVNELSEKQQSKLDYYDEGDR